LRGGGTIALLKAQATGAFPPSPPSPGRASRRRRSLAETFEYCVREAMQIFGGAAYTRSGVGEKIERLYRDAKAYSCALLPPLLNSPRRAC